MSRLGTKNQGSPLYIYFNGQNIKGVDTFCAYGSAEFDDARHNNSGKVICHCLFLFHILGKARKRERRKRRRRIIFFFSALLFWSFLLSLLLTSLVGCLLSLSRAGAAVLTRQRGSSSALLTMELAGRAWWGGNWACLRHSRRLLLYSTKRAAHKRLISKWTAKFNHLLAELTLGNPAPSQLLYQMKQLAGDKVDTELLRTLRLQRLPENTQAILTFGFGVSEHINCHCR